MINITLSISLQTIFSGILTPRFFSLSQLGRQIIHGHHSLHQYSWRNILQSGDVIHFCIERWNHVDSPYKAVFFHSTSYTLKLLLSVQRTAQKNVCVNALKRNRGVALWPAGLVLTYSRKAQATRLLKWPLTSPWEDSFRQSRRCLTRGINAMIFRWDMP